ncbi:methyltransferase, FxLD system [Nocardioides sp. NPDC057772]|uniref:methyltransferase, FxLD system n=1 Tax=Nocardioides sp. NPDC057772 TaxID=3346245 RepID=UPI003671C8F4
MSDRNLRPTEETFTEQRAKMVDHLVAIGDARTPAVIAALGKVPRHLISGIDPEQAYDPENALVTKTSAEGQNLSSVSAARIQAIQLEQAELRPGHRVLEIGSGGVNAAYVAEIVGASGRVVTLDIDADVTARADRFLEAAGYDRVTVVTGDGAEGAAAYAPFDRIIVTVETTDIPPAWWDQLAPGGRIVAPLRVRGMTRTVGLARHGDRLDSTSVEVCGFVPMQGSGEDAQRLILLNGTSEERVALRVDGGDTFDAEALGAALRMTPVTEWTGVTMGGTESLEHLDLWLTTALDPMPLLVADLGAKAAGLVASASPLGVPTWVDAASFAYRTVRGTDDPEAWEIGVIGHGPEAKSVADTYAAQIRAWGTARRKDPHLNIARRAAAPEPDGSDDNASLTRTIRRRHTRVTISWP